MLRSVIRKISAIISKYPNKNFEILSNKGSSNVKSPNLHILIVPSTIWAAVDYDIRVPRDRAGRWLCGRSKHRCFLYRRCSAKKLIQLCWLKQSNVVSGSYHWPVAGREFYEVGVVDGVTSKYVAGISYNTYQEVQN